MVNQTQNTLHPNNKLSNIQTTIKQTQTFKNHVLKHLNTNKTIQNFLITTIKLLTKTINLLILQIFHKNNYTIKYTIKPLLNNNNPLNNLSIHLKLIYKLNIINHQKYKNTKLLITLHKKLNHNNNKYTFTNNKILKPFNKLHYITTLPPPPQFKPTNSNLYTIQIQHYQQTIQSTIILSLTKLISKINLKKTFQK